MCPRLSPLQGRVVVAADDLVVLPKDDLDRLE